MDYIPSLRPFSSCWRYFGLPKRAASLDHDAAADFKPRPRVTLTLRGIASGGMSGIFTVGGGLDRLPMALAAMLSLPWGVALTYKLPAVRLRAFVLTLSCSGRLQAC